MNVQCCFITMSQLCRMFLAFSIPRIKMWISSRSLSCYVLYFGWVIRLNMIFFFDSFKCILWDGHLNSWKGKMAQRLQMSRRHCKLWKTLALPCALLSITCQLRPKKSSVTWETSQATYGAFQNSAKMVTKLYKILIQMCLFTFQCTCTLLAAMLVRMVNIWMSKLMQTYCNMCYAYK